MTRLLPSKTAIVYGAGGGLGGAVARTFAREGATVYLTGRTRAPLDRLATEIAGDGGRAHVAVVDALDQGVVNEHADAVAAAAGGIDVSFNLVSSGDVQGLPIGPRRDGAPAGGAFGDEGLGEWRLRPTRANRRPAAASWLRRPGDTELRAFKLDVLRVCGDWIAEITTFDATPFEAFGLPPTL